MSEERNPQVVPKLSVTREGQIYIEPLIFERSRPDRVGFALPEDDLDLPESLPSDLRRKNAARLPEVAESDVVRHFTRLSTLNYAIDLNIYPLGSCTMKYNPRLNETIAAREWITGSHPEWPTEHQQPILYLYHELQSRLSALTDMAGCTLQPAAGAHGELTGLYMIAAALRDRNEIRRTILIPDSAHGTNPATAALAGFRTREIPSRSDGLFDLEALREALDSDVAALMITNPNTLGIFEQEIAEMATALHANGSYLYMDGANFNAIVGKVSLTKMGVDVCHLNLHKTFSTPHGGGGPGAAAVVVADSLVDFLPTPIASKSGDRFEWRSPKKTIGRVKASPGHTGVLARALTYLMSCGNDIDRIAEHAVLNAALVRHELKEHYQIASSQDSMHEAVFSDAALKGAKAETIDIAKNMIDYGFHPPTIYFPLNVRGAMMVEPTETESPETIRELTAVMRDLAQRAKAQDPTLDGAPRRTFVRRIDETAAARNPQLNYFTSEATSGKEG